MNSDKYADANGPSRRQQNGNGGTSQRSERHVDSGSTRPIKEHDVVWIVRDVEIEGGKFTEGMEGTVVSVNRSGEGYAVEFESGDSQIVVVTLYPAQIALAS